MYGKKLDKLAADSDQKFAKINKGLTNLSNNGKQAAKSISEIDKRIQSLRERVNLTVDTSAIKAANREIAALQKQKEKMEGLGMRGSVGSRIGGLGKGLIVGAIAGLGTGALSAVIDKAVESTAKYEKFEAVLSNTLGSRGVGKNVMSEISDFASKTPFQVDELTASYVKLANQGFTPTLRQMTSLGDLASSTGKSYDQLSEALLDAQQGEFERLKEFGIRAESQGKKVAFTFKGQTTVVDKTAASMRAYVLSLGNAVGVSGAMEKIAATTGGELSNLGDNVDLLWKAVGERFNPQIRSGTGLLNKFVSTVRGWMKIPVEKKVQDEIIKIRQLQVELTSANTSEARRKEILQELSDINPKITEGISSQAIEYDKLATNIERVVSGLRDKIAVENLNKEFAPTLSKYYDLQKRREERMAYLRSRAFELNPMVAKSPNLTDEQKFAFISKSLSAQDSQWYRENEDKRGRVRSPFSKDAQYFGTAFQGLMATDAELKKMAPEYQKFQDKKNFMMGEMERKLGTTEEQIKLAGGGTASGGGKGAGGRSLDTAGINSVSSGETVKNIYVNINQLIGEYNAISNTVRESAGRAKDIVLEALTTSVNDANLAGGGD